MQSVGLPSNKHMYVLHHHGNLTTEAMIDTYNFDDLSLLSHDSISDLIEKKVMFSWARDSR